MSFALKTCPTSGCPGSERTFVSPVHDRKELKFCEYCGTPLILDPHYPESALSIKTHSPVKYSKETVGACHENPGG